MSAASIAQKAVQGSVYSSVAGGINFVLSFIRSVLLARWLLPEHFGIATLAILLVGLMQRFHGIGLHTAIIHFQDDSEDLRRTFFTLHIIVSVLQTVLLLVIAQALPYVYPDMPALKEVVIVIAIITFIGGLNDIQWTLASKNLQFKTLVFIDVVAVVAMTVVAPAAAWFGWGVWALVAELGSAVIVESFLYWGPFRQWRPRFGWDRKTTDLFFRFGKPYWIKENLDYLLHRFDDFWIGSTLGKYPLGLYAKAYDFAGAPSRVCTEPLLKVFGPVFARLQDDRERLSRAFFKSAYLSTRIVLLGAGIFILIIPEFIQLVIGEKWLPMLWTFRLLLVYATIFSWMRLIRSLINSVGKPEILRNCSILQVLFFVPAVIVGAHAGGIMGVALAADAMLLVGAWYVYYPLKKIVDFSVWRLAGWPLIALSTAISCGIAIEFILYDAIWKTLLLKITIYLLLFCGVLLAIEHKSYMREFKELREMLGRDTAGAGVVG